MRRFETEFLATDENLAALADHSGHRIDRVHDHRLPKKINRDTKISVSPTHGAQEDTATCTVAMAGTMSWIWL